MSDREGPAPPPFPASASPTAVRPHLEGRLAGLEPDPDLDARVQALTRELRCLVCRNESIAESRAPFAVDLRQRVRAMLAAGHSPQAVRRSLAERYGDLIDYRPPLDPRTAVLWGGPALLVLGSAVGVAALVRRRRALRTGPASAGGNR